MKEKPILFSGPMIRALLDGRKTQTRRIMKPQPIQNGFGPPDPVHDIPCHCDYYPPSAMLWPDENGGMLNGDAGHPWLGVERLWVKETFARVSDGEKEGTVFRADPCGESGIDRDAGECWMPSIFMPRWASRITLELSYVRGERLNKISASDAISEGIEVVNDGPYRFYRNYLGGEDLPDPVESYGTLWDSINGAGACLLNPWVWVLEFRKL